MGGRIGIALGLVLVGACTSSAADRTDHSVLDRELHRLNTAGAFDGAVVVRHGERVVFAKGYGLADPFSGRSFTPDVKVDSASLAKPVTAAAVLMLAERGSIDLNRPVHRYLPEFPRIRTTVGQLLSHSAALPSDGALEPLAGKSNHDLLIAMGEEAIWPGYPPDAKFEYCNACYNTLALLVEQVSGMTLVEFAQKELGLPASVAVRPRTLAEWRGRAIGFRRTTSGDYRRADSYENEVFYGSGNLGVTARELANWGSEWWSPTLSPIERMATTPATIAGSPSGLTWGSWYCAPDRRRCHYLGHHEGFHHMLYWNSARRISVAMVSNNSLAPGLQQPLQRALVAYAEGRLNDARRALARTLPGRAPEPGAYRISADQTVVLRRNEGPTMTVVRGDIPYTAYPVGSGIRYVPGLDVYLATARTGSLRWVSLYEDRLLPRIP